MDGAWGLPALVPVAVAAPAVCASHTYAIFIARETGGQSCAPEIVCNPDEPKRWQLPVWRVAKGREDCRVTGDRALTYALPVPACC